MTEDEMLALLATSEGALRASWAEVIAWLRENNDLRDVEEAIAGGDVDRVIRGLDLAAQRFAEEIASRIAVAAVAAARAASEATGRLISYDSSNVFATRLLTEERMRVISDLVAEQRELIRQVLSRGIAEGINPRKLARELVDSLGLTPAMEATVARYEAELRAGQFALARRRALRDARSDRSLRGELTDGQVESMVARYRDGWRQHRAEAIARTEALAALHEGVDELFRQAFASGELSENEVEVIWTSALKTTTRDAHRAMHDQRRRPGEPFTSGAGNQLRFPGDPRAPASERVHCICVLRRVMRPRLDVAFG